MSEKRNNIDIDKSTIVKAQKKFSEDSILLTGDEIAIVDHQKLNILDVLNGAKANRLNELVDAAWLYYSGNKYKGNVLHADRQFALNLLRILADTGNKAVRHNYAAMLREEGEFSTALQIIEQLVVEGDLPAIARLAAMHRTGNGAEKNEELFLKYANLASNKGHFVAESMILIHHLRNGSLIEKIRAFFSVPGLFIRSAKSKIENPYSDVHFH